MTISLPQHIHFPYTTLFRSLELRSRAVDCPNGSGRSIPDCPIQRLLRVRPPARATKIGEHTSELQSPCNLVCRLLLDKKNNIKIKYDDSNVNSKMKMKVDEF